MSSATLKSVMTSTLNAASSGVSNRNESGRRRPVSSSLPSPPLRMLLPLLPRTTLPLALPVRLIAAVPSSSVVRRVSTSAPAVSVQLTLVRTSSMPWPPNSVDRVAGVVDEVDVVAAAADHLIGAAAAVEDVVAVPAVEEVVTSATFEPVVVALAAETVVMAKTPEQVGAVVTLQQIPVAGTGDVLDAAERVALGIRERCIVPEEGDLDGDECGASDDSL